MRLVINKCYGGYSLSPEACLWLWERGFRGEDFATPVEKYWGPRDDTARAKEQLEGWRKYLTKGKAGGEFFLTVFSPDESFVLNSRPPNRADPLLVACVEALGKKANGGCADLAVVEIPDGVEWEIDEYDGNEHVAEVHRTWR